MDIGPDYLYIDKNFNVSFFLWMGGVGLISFEIFNINLNLIGCMFILY